MSGDLKAEIASLRVIVEHYARATEQLAAAGKDTADTAGEHRARIEAAEDAINRLEERERANNSRLSVVEELLRRKNTPTPHATHVGELAQVEIEKTKARWGALSKAVPQAIKVALVGGVGAGVVKAIEWVKEALHK